MMNRCVVASGGIALVIVTLLAGCGSLETPDTATTTVVLDATVTIEVPTATLTPRSSNTPTTESPTATPFPTPTPAPTLTERQLSDFVVQKLQNNGGCDLPCWWGIVPGETKMPKVQGYFAEQGIRMYDGEVGFSVPGIQDASYSGFVMFKAKNEVVNLVLVQSQPVGVGGIPREAHERFARDWDYYAWSNMLTRHGVPSEILFDIDPIMVVDDHGAWGLILIYESLGMAIEYLGPAPLAPVDASFARACLRFDEVDLLRVYLIDPKDSITRYLVEVRGSYIVRQSLEKTCGMTNEEAYELLKDSGSNVCLEQALPGR